MFGSNYPLIKRLFSESFSKYKYLYFLSMIAMLVVSASTAATAFVIGKIVDVMSGIDGLFSIESVSVLIFTLFFIRGIGSYLQEVGLSKAGASIIADKQSEIFSHILSLDVDYFVLNNSSDLILRITKSVSQAKKLIEILITGFVKDLFTLAALLFVMFYQQPLLSLICFAIGPITIVGIQKIQRNLNILMREENEGSKNLIKTIQEVALGNKEVKSYRLEPMLLLKMQKVVLLIKNKTEKMARKTALTVPLMDIIAGSSIAAVVLLSRADIQVSNGASPGNLVSFVTAFLMAYEPAKRLARLNANMKKNIVGVELIYELLDQKIESRKSKSMQLVDKKSFSIKFQNINFKYSNENPIIDNISFEVPKGSIVSFVGPSGGGKTTILNLMLNFYQPSSGSILFDNQNLNDISVESLRKNVAFVGQQNFLFDGSIKDNIKCGNLNSSDEDLQLAVKLAGLQELIKKLPQGIDTQIGEDGALFSGGQKQRIAIARAFIADAPLLILDEATSALDSDNELLFRNSLSTMKGRQTIVIVTHRLSSIHGSDLIFYVEDGKILERGTLEHLVKLNGRFNSMYNEYYIAAENSKLTNKLHLF